VDLPLGTNGRRWEEIIFELQRRGL
jgi:hypothetical protein